MTGWLDDDGHPVGFQVTFFRTPYDVAVSQLAIRDAHLPERLAVRLGAGR